MAVEVAQRSRGGGGGGGDPLAGGVLPRVMGCYLLEGLVTSMVGNRASPNAVTSRTKF